MKRTGKKAWGSLKELVIRVGSVIFILLTMSIIPSNDLAITQSTMTNFQFAAAPSRETQQFVILTTALEKAQEQNYSEALQILNQIIESGPVLTMNAEIHYHRAKISELIFDYEQAEQDYRVVLESSPPLFILKDTLYRLGELKYRFGHFDDAQKYLEEAQTYFPSSPNQAENFFTLGFLSAKNGDVTNVISYYENFINANPEIADFGLFYCAQALEQSDDYDLAIDYYRKLIEHYNKSVLFTEAVLKQALCYEYRNDYSKALKNFQLLQKKYQSKVDPIRIKYHIAVCQSKSGQQQPALKAFREIIANNTESDYAAYSLNHINSLTEGNFTAQDYLDAGYVRYHRREFDKARINFATFIRRQPKSHQVAEARFMLGRIYQKSGNYKRSINEFSTFLKNNPTHPRYAEALYLLGNSYARNGQHLLAIETYHKFLEKFPHNELADETLLDLARSQESLHEFENARETYQTLWKKYPRRDSSQQAQLQLGLNHYMEGDFSEAEELFSQLIESNPEKALTESGLYWLYQSSLYQFPFYPNQTVLSRADSEFPFSYYRNFDLEGRFFPKHRPVNVNEFSLARKIMKNDLNDLKTWISQQYPTRDFDEAEKTLSAHLSFAKGKLLNELGLDKDGRQELVKAEEHFRKDPVILWHLLSFYLTKNYYQQAILCSWKIKDNCAAEGTDAPDFLMRFIYPIHYPELIFAQAKDSNVDPLFLCALIRQESMFEAGVSSWANAHGLLQIIPSTAKYIAAELDITNFEQSSLFLPKRSLKFGTWYLTDLVDQFDGRYVHALAGYNGGPGNIPRWRDMAVLDRDDLFSEKITYKETRNYVKKILSHYQYYQYLWSDFFTKDV